MATNCERCGYRDNAVVTGGGTEKTGTRITLTINGREDMSRDLLKVCARIRASVLPCCGAFSWRPVLDLSRKTDQFRLDPTQNCAPGWWFDQV